VIAKGDHSFAFVALMCRVVRLFSLARLTIGSNLCDILGY
jgi:hypothetical protein